MAVDIETCDPQLTELGPGVRRGAFIAGVSFAVEDGPSFYLPIAHEGGDNLPREHVLQYLRDQAAAFRGTIVGMNLPYDLDFLAEERIVFREAQFRDVSVAACLINELHDSYSLEAILGRAGLPGKSEAGLERAARAWGLGKYVEKKFRVKEDLWRLPARHVAEYAIGDVELPLLLLRRQEREIEKQDLGQIWDLESRVLPVCVKMRRRGIRIDLQRLDQVETWLHGEEVLALGKVDHLTGVKIPPKDLLKKALVVRAFDAIGVELPRTPTGQPKLTADVLRGIDHPVARELLRAKKLHKIRCDFVSSVRRHEVGGRIHPTFRSVKGAADGWKDDSEGAAYGRFAGSHPNLQQQPNPEKDPEISGVWRQIYLPDEGKVLAAIDYCYDDETEILTEHGWLPFANLTENIQVAEWCEGRIEYVLPTSIIRGRSPGFLVEIRGERQIDLAVTPKHRCYYLDKNCNVVVQRASEGVDPSWRIPQNGVMVGEDSADARLAAAVQADASYRRTSYRFYLKKQRKIERLLFLLNEAKIDYSTGPVRSKPGFTFVTVPSSCVEKFIEPGANKDFKRRAVLSLTEDRRRQFIDELLLWDGDIRSKAYLSTNLDNCEAVQEIAVVTGYRSNFKIRRQKGKKPLGVVSLNDRPGTYVKTLKYSTRPYDGPVYCVQVASGAVLVRRRGRVCVSGNSAQEPRMLVHYAALTNCPGGREMAARYQENPRLDLHQATADLCEIKRKPAKIIFLGKVYGMGGAKLCDSLGLPTEWWQPPTGKKVRVAGPEGRALIEAFNRLAPFVQRMSQGTETRARKAGYIRTILGRHCRFPRNPLKPNEYEWTHKALNRLIQGSSADQTKQAMVDAEAAGYKIQLPVHDELVLSVSDRAEAEEVGRIMCEAVPLLVPSMVDVAIGPSWGEVKE